MYNFSFLVQKVVEVEKMKKIFIILGIIFVYFAIISPKTSASIIPDEAIRFRVIPNSNSEEDQRIKYKVRDELQLELYTLLKDTKGIEDAREKLTNEMDQIKANIEKVLISENYDKGYQLSFGRNYFPEKTYKGIVYDAGYYESLVVTLGAGEGDNWWCVLFPPLCLLEAEESEEEVEYKFFFQELIDKYL